MPVKEYTKDVALAAGSEGGIQTLSLMPLDRLVPKGAQSTAVHREGDQASEWNHLNGKYKDESGMWYGTDKFGKSNSPGVLRLVDRKTNGVSQLHGGCRSLGCGLRVRRYVVVRVPRSVSR